MNDNIRVVSDTESPVRGFYTKTSGMEPTWESMDTIPSRKISVQHGISGYKASLQDRESTSRLRVVIDFEFVSKEACHNFYTDLNTKPDLYRYTFILHIIEGSLDEVKLRAKNALHALACQKKSELKNDHAERDFFWTDERTTGYTPTRSRPR